MLAVAAFEVGDPVVFVVEVEAGDLASHAWGSVVGGSADRRIDG